MASRSALRAWLRLSAAIPLVALACAAGAAFAAAANPAAPTVDIPFEKYTLPNGLDVVLGVDRRVPVAAVNIWYHVGPANEAAGRTGFAHLFEHLMFQASAHVPEDKYFTWLQGVGASIVNGSTWFDRTNYLEDVPANQLEMALWMESDRMGFLLDRIDASTLARQQEVVRNERRQSVENAPYGLAEEALYQALYPAGHPYHAYIMGSHADLQSIRLEDVHDFFRRYYAPNNASLCIVGDIDIAATKRMIAKYFGTIPRGEPVPPITAVTPPIMAERRLTLTDEVELPRIYLSWLTAPIYKPGDATALLAAQILSGGKAARLDSVMVFDRRLAQSVGATQTSLALGSNFEIRATAKPGHTVEELETAIDAELARLAESGPSEAEMTRARNVIWSQFLSQLERPGAFGGVADQLNQYNHHLGNPGWFNSDLERYARVTREDIRRFVRETLAKDRRIVVACLPGEKVVPPGPPAPPAPPPVEVKITETEPWRAQRPAAGPEPVFTLPVAKSFQLANGLPVYLLESRHLPLFTAQLVVRSGSGSDPADRAGLAALTAQLLDEGTDRRDALGLTRELETLGASIFTNANEDGSNVICRGLARNAGPVLDIMADVALAPAFAQTDLDRVRNDALTNIRQQRDSTNGTARRLLSPCLYGARHPYGHPAAGDEKSLQAITRDDVTGFYRGHYVPANAALVVSGDISQAELKRLAERAFGGWRGAAAPSVAAQAPQPIAEPIVVADKPGSTQTSVYVAQVCVPRADPDFERLDVLNQVLGGSSAGRLFMNLREDKGWTYGAYSQLTWRRGAGPLQMSSRVQGDASAGAIVEIRREFAGLLEREVSEADLAQAKGELVRTLPASFTTTGDLAGTAAALFLYDQRQDYFRDYARRVSALTAAEVLAAGRRHLDPARLRAVLVGDAARIMPLLAQSQLGPVARLTLDGEPLPPAE